MFVLTYAWKGCIKIMNNKIISSAKLIILLHILKIYAVTCDLDNAISEEVEAKANKIKFVNEKFEEITVLDDRGQIKTMKIKSVKPKVKKVTVTSNKVPNQVEMPVILNDNGVKKGQNKSKFFDELEECKYI